MPLLYEASWVFLATPPAAATANERSHSVAGRICSKMRAALKETKLERLTLAYYYLPVAAKELADDFAQRLSLASSADLDLADVDCAARCGDVERADG